MDQSNETTREQKSTKEVPHGRCTFRRRLGNQKQGLKPDTLWGQPDLIGRIVGDCRTMKSDRQESRAESTHAGYFREWGPNVANAIQIIS